MGIQLLGPVRVRAGSGYADIGSAKPRLVLAALVAFPGHAVPLGVLAERVWGASLPRDPGAGLYPYLSQLRRALAPAGIGIVRTDGGYLCDVSAERVDVAQFRSALAAAKEVAEDDAGSAEAVELLDAALDLWHGEPLADLDGDWACRYRESLHQERLAALILRAGRHQRRGQLAGTADLLLEAAADYPLSEPLAWYVMCALALSGRRAEALEHYARMRERLADELGEEPGDELGELHLRLLRRDPELTGEGPVARPPVVPRQLPTATRHFAGRADALSKLDEVLAAAEQPTAVVVSAVSGVGGIGKTSLVLHWAHLVRHRFPDGQLFVNLRGYGPSAPLSPADVLGWFLESIGVPAERMPADAEARSAMFRSSMADRRMLIVLDNVRDPRQVRPLLPGSGGSFVVLTSRNQLRGLSVHDGAHRITLDQLSAAEGCALLAHLVGADRVAAEPDAAAELVALCAGLPLAVSIVGERAARLPDVRLAELAAELENVTERLEVLRGDEPDSCVRTVWSWSYAALDAEQARLFRLLALHPGTDFEVVAAAALADTDVSRARTLLDGLVGVHLLEQRQTGRWEFHDLVLLYAAELVAGSESADAVRDARTRLFDHYLQTASDAVDLATPHAMDGRPLALPRTRPGSRFADLAEAERWLEAERANLVAVATHAATHGWPDHVVDLSLVVAWYLFIRAHHGTALVLHSLALTVASTAGPRRSGHVVSRLGLTQLVQGDYPRAAESFRKAVGWLHEAGDVRAEVSALSNLGIVHLRLGEYEDAERCYERGLELARTLGNPREVGVLLANLGLVQERSSRLDAARRSYERALEIARQTDDGSSEAIALNNLGGVEAALGNHDDALTHVLAGLELARQNGYREVEGQSLIELGTVYWRTERFADARAHQLAALELSREAGLRTMEAEALNGLGRTARSAGALTEAVELHSQALTIARDLGDGWEELRALDGLRDNAAGRGQEMKHDD